MGSFDNEVVMMNHVYKERFPKVCHVVFSPFFVQEAMSVCICNNQKAYVL